MPPKSDASAARPGRHKCHDIALVAEWCCHCLNLLSKNHEIRCNYNFGGASEKCRNCIDSRHGRQKPCVGPPSGSKDTADKLVNRARDLCAIEYKVKELIEKAKHAHWRKKPEYAIMKTECQKELDVAKSAFDQVVLEWTAELKKYGGTYGRMALQRQTDNANAGVKSIKTRAPNQTPALPQPDSDEEKIRRCVEALDNAITAVYELPSALNSLFRSNGAASLSNDHMLSILNRRVDFEQACSAYIDTLRGLEWEGILPSQPDRQEPNTTGNKEYWARPAGVGMQETYMEGSQGQGFPMNSAPGNPDSLSGFPVQETFNLGAGGDGYPTREQIGEVNERRRNCGQLLVSNTSEHCDFASDNDTRLDRTAQDTKSTMNAINLPPELRLQADDVVAACDEISRCKSVMLQHNVVGAFDEQHPVHKKILEEWREAKDNYEKTLKEWTEISNFDRAKTSMMILLETEARQAAERVDKAKSQSDDNADEVKLFLRHAKAMSAALSVTHKIEESFSSPDAAAVTDRIIQLYHENNKVMNEVKARWDNLGEMMVKNGAKDPAPRRELDMAYVGGGGGSEFARHGAGIFDENQDVDDDEGSLWRNIGFSDNDAEQNNEAQVGVGDHGPSGFPMVAAQDGLAYDNASQYAEASHDASNQNNHVQDNLMQQGVSVSDGPIMMQNTNMHSTPTYYTQMPTAPMYAGPMQTEPMELVSTHDTPMEDATMHDAPASNDGVDTAQIQPVNMHQGASAQGTPTEDDGGSEAFTLPDGLKLPPGVGMPPGKTLAELEEINWELYVNSNGTLFYYD